MAADPAKFDINDQYIGRKLSDNGRYTIAYDPIYDKDYQEYVKSTIQLPDMITFQQKHDRQLKWDRRYMELAKHVSAYSKDPSTKVGAVIVRDNTVLGMGYNGFPRGVQDLPERYNDRPTKLMYVVHAEANAIINANQSVKDATIYIWPPLGNPQSACCDCAKLIIQSGIKRVVGYIDDSGKEPSQTWKQSIDAGRTMFSEVGIQMDSITP